MGNSLAGKTLFITGASRGIGKAIGLRAARDGANVVVAAKTDRKHPVLPGTIHTAVEEIEAAGGRGLALRLDVRDEQAIESAVEEAVAHFGGIDILVNNASAIPQLVRSSNPHVLNLAPPLNLNPEWFKGHVAYSIAKYGMSMCVLGMAEEFRAEGIAFNALWPRTVISTAAIAILGDAVKPENCRTADIMADAAHAIFRQDARRCTGRFFLDEDVLRATGVRDFDRYAVQPGAPLMRDLFLDT